MFSPPLLGNPAVLNTNNAVGKLGDLIVMSNHHNGLMNFWLVIFKRPEDYLVFLAVSGKENRADLVGWEKGLRLTLSSNCAGKRKMQDVALICGAGKDPYAVTEEAVKWALKLPERT